MKQNKIKLSERDVKFT